jgi:hypothetical protein
MIWKVLLDVFSGGLHESHQSGCMEFLVHLIKRGNNRGLSICDRENLGTAQTRCTASIAFVSVWLWAVSFHGGRSLRVWLETKNPTLPEVLSAGKNLFSQVFNSIWKWTQSQLKNRFGIEVKLPSLPEFQQLETVQGNSSSAIVTEPSKK